MDKLALDLFSRLPKSGKPSNKGKKVEWTVLAAIIQTDAKKSITVALGTGTKCLPIASIKPYGSQVLDCHAEIVAKRAFQLYIYSQLSDAIEMKTSILKYSLALKRWELKEGVTFHMYISQAMCGDASMSYLADSKTPEEMIVITDRKRRYAESARGIEDAKRQKTSAASIIIRGRESVDKLGCLRTKPGRVDADHTNCMSCTDKVLKWAVVGLGGSLLSNLVCPLYLSSLTVGDGWSDQDKARFTHRLLKLPNAQIFEIHDSTLAFEFSRVSVDATIPDGKMTICGDSAICWNAEYRHGILQRDQLQVLVNGKKQGSIKADKDHGQRQATRSRISSAALLDRFLDTVTMIRDIGIETRIEVLTVEEMGQLAYRSVKNLNTEYNKRRNSLVDFLGGWSVKDSLLQKFTSKGDIA